MGLLSASLGALLDRRDARVIRDAERRWRDFNAEQDAMQVCMCGARGALRRASTIGQVGSVAPVFWWCDEHATVPLDVPWVGGRPMIDQTRDTCTWRQASLTTNKVTKCGCGTHVGETR